MSAALPTSGRAAHAALRGAAAALLDLVLPRACAACAASLSAHEQGLVCGRCWSRTRPLPAPRCERCGHPFPRGRGACAWCAILPPYVRAVRSACWTSPGSGGAIVHALKYRGWHAVSSQMGRYMARLEWPRDVVEERTALVPVPLAPSRERERGFNQSERLAAALASWWRVPVWSHCLERVRVTRAQARLTSGERSGNVDGAFRVASDMSREALRGTHLVLVDDVVTTAATVLACARALHEGGARIISIVSFARAPAPGDRC